MYYSFPEKKKSVPELNDQPTYDEKLTGGKKSELFLLSVQVS